MDSMGSLFIAVHGNHRIREVTYGWTKIVIRKSEELTGLGSDDGVCIINLNEIDMYLDGVALSKASMNVSASSTFSGTAWSTCTNNEYTSTEYCHSGASDSAAVYKITTDESYSRVNVTNRKDCAGCKPRIDCFLMEAWIDGQLAETFSFQDQGSGLDSYAFDLGLLPTCSSSSTAPVGVDVGSNVSAYSLRQNYSLVGSQIAMDGSRRIGFSFQDTSTEMLHRSVYYFVSLPLITSTLGGVDPSSTKIVQIKMYSNSNNAYACQNYTKTCSNLIYSKGSYGDVDVGMTVADAKFQSNASVFVRLCYDCVDSHKTIYYKRLTDVPSGFSVYNNIKSLWSSSNSNALNVDFKLYGSYSDLLKDENAWQYCNYDVNVGMLSMT